MTSAERSRPAESQSRATETRTRNPLPLSEPADRHLQSFSAVIAILLAGGVLLSWVRGEIFPWIPGSVYLSVLLVVSVVVFEIGGLSRYRWSLVALCTIGVSFRVPMVVLPGTLSGNDAEKYALLARITLANDRYFIPGLDFYGTAGAFHTYIAETAAIAGVSPESAMAVVGLFIGLWAPLIAAGFCLAILGKTETGYEAAVLAAVVATVATISVRISYIPFGQSLGTILFVTVLFVAIRHIDARRRSLMAALVVLVVAVALSHKLPLVIAAPLSFVVWLVTLVSASGRLPRLSTRRRLSGWIVIVLTVAAMVQQLLLTSFLDEAMDLIRSTAGSASVPTRTGVHPDASVVPTVGAYRLMEFHSHAPVTLLLAGLSWALIAWFLLLRSDRPRGTTVGLLTAVATLVVIVGLTLGTAISTTGVNPFRIYALVELALASLIGIGLVISKIETPRLRTAMIVFLMVVVIFNAFSTAATPDTVGQERQYLTPQEMTAKQFAVEHVPGPIFTDERYARQTPFRGRVTNTSNPWVRLGGVPQDVKFVPFNEALVNGTALSGGRQYVMYRTTADIYGTGGAYKNYRYQLRWDVESRADRRFQRVYDNGEVLIYKNTTVP